MCSSRLCKGNKDIKYKYILLGNLLVIILFFSHKLQFIVSLIDKYRKLKKKIIIIKKVLNKMTILI